MSNQQGYMEAAHQRVADLKGKNELKRQTIEDAKKAFIERHVRIGQLISQLSSQKEMLKQTKGNIEMAQKNYQHEFERVKKSAYELNCIALDGNKKRQKLAHHVSALCDRKIEQIKKNLYAVNATRYTKSFEEIEKLMFEKKTVRTKQQSSARMNAFNRDQLKKIYEEQLKTYQSIEKEREKSATNRQVLQEQLAENNLIKTEMDFLEYRTNVFQLSGSTLAKRDLDASKDNFIQRLQYIIDGLNRCGKSLNDTTKRFTTTRETVERFMKALQEASGEDN